MIGYIRGTLLTCSVASVACRGSPNPQGTNTAAPAGTHVLQVGEQSPAPGRLIRLAPAPPIRAVFLVDSAFVHVGTMERYIYHVAMRHDSSVDTLRGIITVTRPTLVADSLVLGVTYDSSTAAGYSLFRYSAPSGQLEISDPPGDLRLAVSEPAFAPDGRYVAYIAFPGDATGKGVLRRWPKGELLLQTPSDTVPASDVTGGWADWTDVSHFELYMVIADDKWVRFRGVVDRPSVVTDTVTPPAAQ